MSSFGIHRPQRGHGVGHSSITSSTSAATVCAAATRAWPRFTRCSPSPHCVIPSTPTTSAACSRSPPNDADHSVITYLTDIEAQALLDAPDRATRTGRRDHAILALAIQTGLRASELISLTRNDIHLDTAAHVACRGKGRKHRITPLTAATVAILRDWITETGGICADPLFPTIRGGPMSPDALAQRVAVHAATAAASCPSLAGKNVTPHVLRHSAAMRLLHAGVDTTVIALWLGHENVTTTRIYLKPT